MMSTRPQMLGYELADSPAGLAAWIYDKFAAWTYNAVDLSIRLATVFPGEIYRAPRSWAERNYHNLMYWNEVQAAFRSLR
jgi:hypothetical protein